MTLDHRSYTIDSVNKHTFNLCIKYNDIICARKNRNFARINAREIDVLYNYTCSIPFFFFVAWC